MLPWSWRRQTPDGHGRRDRGTWPVTCTWWGCPHHRTARSRSRSSPQDQIGSGGLAISSLQPDRWLVAQRLARQRIRGHESEAKRCEVTHSHDQIKAGEGARSLPGQVGDGCGFGRWRLGEERHPAKWCVSGAWEAQRPRSRLRCLPGAWCWCAARVSNPDPADTRADLFDDARCRSKPLYFLDVRRSVGVRRPCLARDVAR